MELEWESRPVSVSIHHNSREWNGRSQSGAGPSSAAPSSFVPNTSPLSQRRRSSAAHTRPAGPPPNLPIPKLPGLSTIEQPIDEGITYLEEDSFYPQSYTNGTGGGTNFLSRPGASPNLTAVAAFSQSRQAASANSPQLSASSSSENLSDPPPRSILHSSRNPDRHQDIVPDRLLLSPPESRPTNESRPSSRRALTRALELAREAVMLDSTNDNPHAAVAAYGQSVALLSEVMERVRRGEDSTESHRKRNGRRRSVVAQEEEVRRLKSIVSDDFMRLIFCSAHIGYYRCYQHDTYADRMNILSLIYSIPPIPHSTSALYSAMTISSESMQPPSPSTSASPSSESTDTIPSSSYTHHHDQEDPRDFMDQYAGHDRDREATESIGSAMFVSMSGTTAAGNILNTAANSTPHPYAIASQYDGYDVPQTVVTPPTNPPPVSNRLSITARRARASSSLPPPPPPPLNSPPAAPSTAESSPEPSLQIPRHLESGRPRGSSTSGHSRSGSGSRLAALEEEYEKGDDDFAEDFLQTESEDDLQVDPQQYVVTPRNPKHDSHPLPPIPSPSSFPGSSPGTPRKPSPSPGSSFTPRPRGQSQLSNRSEVSIPSSAQLPVNLINSSTNQGTIFQRRKTSAPPSLRSSSPTESTASVGSVPKSIVSSLPASTATSLGIGRTRSTSQPGRRPSLVGGGISPPDQRPPLPATAGGLNSNGIRKTSFPSKLNPNPQALVQTDLYPLNSASLIPPPPVLAGNLPTMPTSPLPPAPPTDPQRKPYHMMNLLRNTMTSQTGGYVTRRLHVPQEVWSQGGAKLTNVLEKVRVVGILCSALEDLQVASSEHFGAGNVSSGLALGIGSVGRKEGEAWIAKLEEFSSICDSVVANFGKKLGVGEGFVLKKNTGVSRVASLGNSLLLMLGVFIGNILGEQTDSPI